MLITTTVVVSFSPMLEEDVKLMKEFEKKEDLNQWTRTCDSTMVSYKKSETIMSYVDK